MTADWVYLMVSFFAVSLAGCISSVVSERIGYRRYCKKMSRNDRKGALRVDVISKIISAIGLVFGVIYAVSAFVVLAFALAA